MSSRALRSHMGMSIPTVTEVTRRPEAVAHDTFIDDLRKPAPAMPADRGRER
jgi:hypothetical protein